MSVKVRPWCEITLRTKREKTSVTIKFMFPHERHWHPNTANTMCLSSWKKPTRRFLLDYLLVKRKIYNFNEKLDCYLSFACKIHQDLNKFTEQLNKMIQTDFLRLNLTYAMNLEKLHCNGGCLLTPLLRPKWTPDIIHDVWTQRCILRGIYTCLKKKSVRFIQCQRNSIVSDIGRRKLAWVRVLSNQS